MKPYFHFGGFGGRQKYLFKVAVELLFFFSYYAEWRELVLHIGDSQVLDLLHLPF